MEALEAKISQLYNSVNRSDGQPSPSSSQSPKESSERLLHDSKPIESSKSQELIGDLMTGQEADRLLQVFTIDYSPNFPFIHIPPPTSAIHLQGERPFLLHACLAVAAYENPALQRTLTERFRLEVSSRLANGSLMSLDCLQGLMIHCAW